jgi:hypothetical protein
MLYCELDDAFNNKTYKFRESFSNNGGDDYNISKIDMGKFNTGNNKIMYDSDKKGQESDWAPFDSDTELLPKKKLAKTWNKDDTISADSNSTNSTNSTNATNATNATNVKEETKSSRSNDLVGTALTKLIKNRKPTHRECIKLYYNPTSKSNYCFDIALKHITKCSLCKKEISKKKSVKFENRNRDVNSDKKTKKSEDKMSCSSSLNSFINDLRDMRNTNNLKEDFRTDNETLSLIKGKKKPLTNKERFDPESDEKKMASIKSQMELQSPPAKSIAQSTVQQPQENNVQYQNVMIQNTIQKYFEDMEEKKELNDKLNKIYEILNLEIKKNEIIDKERTYMSQLKNNSPNTNTNFEINYVLIGISFVIILLIVDIIIRIKL